MKRYTYLDALVKAGNEACDAAKDYHGDHKDAFPGESINWADLGCVSAEYWEDNQGDSGYRIYIEEASYASWRFRNWVEEWLGERGHGSVLVATEW